MKKFVERRQKHNIGTHKERMASRRIVQLGRQASLFIRRKVGKYSPMVEDMKHRQQAQQEIQEVG